MLGIWMVKFIGLGFCIWHIAATKGKFFKLKPCIAAGILFLLQASILYYIFGDIPRAQYWRWSWSELNDSVATLMTSWYFSRAGWFMAAFVLLINFPHFYFFLILCSKDKKMIGRSIALYALWCLMTWYFSGLEDRETHGRKWHAILARRYRLDYGRVLEAKDRIRELDRAVREFRRDTGKLPRDLKELTVNASSIENWKGPYVKEIPPDPWKRPYIYLAPGKHGEFDILSLGADGKPGGDNVWDEVGNWNLDREIQYLY